MTWRTARLLELDQRSRRTHRRCVDDVMELAATRLLYLIFAVTALLAVVTLRRRLNAPAIEPLGAALVLALAAATVLAHSNSQQRPVPESSRAPS